MIFEILTQSKETLNIDVNSFFNKFFRIDGLQIFSGDVLLGEYATSKRAKEIFDELFIAWITGDKSFLMPEE